MPFDREAHWHLQPAMLQDTAASNGPPAGRPPSHLDPLTQQAQPRARSNS